MTQSPARSRLRTSLDALRRQLWWLVTLALLLLAVYVVLARQAMTLVPELRHQLETLAGERLGAPVTIGSLRGYLDGVVPVFVLQDLEVAAPDADDAPLTLQHVELAIDVGASIWSRSLRLRQLWVRGLDLHLVRDGEGSIRLRGLEALRQDDGADDGGRGLLDIVYRQQRLVLDDVSVRVDWPGLPPLRSDDLSVALVREGSERQVALRLSARDRPLQLDARLRLQGDAYQMEDLRGEGYLRVEGEGLEYWLPETWPLPVKPVAATGRVELWAGVADGAVTGATAVLATREVQLDHEAQALGWRLDRLDARFHLARQAEGYQLTLDELRGETDSVGELRMGPLAAWWDGRFSADTAWRLRAEGLNATAVREQLLAWPFPLPEHLAALREQLVSLAPSGQVPAVYLSGHGAKIAAFNGRFTNLSVAASAARPGVQGVSGWVAGTPEAGIARLTSPALMLDLPALFQAPLAASLSGLVQWHRPAPEALHVRSGVLQAYNADARGKALLDLQLPGGGAAPYLSLRADLHEGNAGHAARYIPLARMGDGAANWLNKAFLGGELRRGRILYEGPLRYDRSQQQSRTQQMAFSVENLTLHYLEGWPDVKAISGTVMLDGLDVLARDLSARYLDSTVQAAQVDVLGIIAGEPLLIISGEVQGPARDLQTVLHETPLADSLPEALQAWQIRSGELDGHLVLQLPLGGGAAQREVVAQARMRGVGLHSDSWRLAATQLAGSGRFSLQDGLQIPALTGVLFGEPITGSVRTGADQVRLAAEGVAPVPALRTWLGEKPWLTPLAGVLPYSAALALPRGGGTVRLQVDSDLHGVSSSLPVPLGKTADERRVSQLVLTARDDRRRLNLHFEQLAAAQLELASDGSLRRGAVRFGAPGAPMPETGLRIDGWLPVLEPLPWALLVADDDSPLRGADSSGGAALPLLNLAVDSAELRFQGQSLGRGSLSLQQRLSGWHLAVASAPLAGELFLPQGYQARGDRPLAVEIGRLHWPFRPGDSVPEVDDVLAQLALPQPDPLRIPAADISVREVVVHGRDYGQWQAQLRPTPDGTHVGGLIGRWRDTTFNGQLNWLATGVQGGASSVSGSFRSTDLGALLGNFGLESFIESRDATGSVDLHWQGSPLAFDYRQLGGSLTVEINNALLPGSDRRTSALRLLGLINIGNTLSRRLRLDFSDVVSEGLLTDRIRGQFIFDGPSISTDNLRIRSSAAEFAIHGTLGLVPQTMDYHIEVTLPLSSNLYAGCLAGPAACASIFVVERLWGERLEKMTSMSYHVSGGWDNPEVEEVQGLFGPRSSGTPSSPGTPPPGD